MKMSEAPIRTNYFPLFSNESLFYQGLAQSLHFLPD